VNIPASIATLALLGLTAGAASAQSAAPAAGSDTTIPEKAPATSVPATTLDDKPGTLSEKLSDSNGVIQPKGDVDPAMHVPAPQTGTTPVIKPGAMGNGTPK